MTDRASTAIVVQEQEKTASLSPVHSEQAILTRDGLKLAAEQRQLLKEYVEKQMIPGTDYGVIPGTKNQTLLKAGAEKLVELFRCTPRFTLMERIENFDKNLFAYTFRVRLFQRDAEVVLAEGYGSCNSREARYRWRNAARKCPSCSKETIIKGKKEYGGGWLCFAKKGGCGAKFDDEDPVIEGQEQGQVENENIADVANTVLKMAKKRALVDGAIALARVSDLFTQDVEEDVQVAPHGAADASGEAVRNNPPPSASPAQGAKKGASAKGKKPQVWERMVALADEHGFVRGNGNAFLWAYVNDVIGKKPTSEWNENDLSKVEAMMVEKEALRNPPEPAQEESDINF